ncbi:MAG: nucleotidyl transferase AbiEii/AbiGii toxin family protein [Myxococcaceae bacterium]|nr:nucleotidyl transferase AbiEii/AbiGii toxin family protein [Myxococcaceae bacterium]
MEGVTLPEYLKALKAGPLGERCILRGSQLTQVWVPGRLANDLDFLLTGDWSVPQALEAVKATGGGEGLAEVIWEETPWPGVRLSMPGLQIDFGWNEKLAAEPVPFTLHGTAWRAVTPEVMFGWKTHSMVEHGERGRWHAKTLADLVLFTRHLKLDWAIAKKAVALAFESKAQSVTMLDGFLDDPTWGGSRGSRNRWKSYKKKAPWVTFSLDEALAEARAAVLPLVRSGTKVGAP